MGIHWKDGGFSTCVEIFLVVDGETIPLSQIGPHSFVLREARSIPRGYARLLIRIDDEEEWHDVILGAADPSEMEVTYA